MCMMQPWQHCHRDWMGDRAMLPYESLLAVREKKNRIKPVK